MELFNIKFAALDIPLERRLQTAAVLFWASLFFFFGLGISVLFLYLLFTPYFWIPLLYYGWIWFDGFQPHRGGRRSEWVRNWCVWRYACNFFPIKIVKTAELDPNKNYICGYHPHGIISVGAFLSFATEAVNFSKIFPNLTPYLLTLNMQFRFPVYRDLLLANGLCSVSRESIKWLLSCCGFGNMVVIVIGGAQEALDAHPGIVRLTLRRRKGFVREALQNGASLIPMFSFGENDLYKQVPNPKGSILRKVQDLFCSTLGFSPPIFRGRGVFVYNVGVLPFRKPVAVVVGKPIDVVKTPNPSQEQIDHYHGLYMQKLTELFDEHKKNYEYYKDTTLQLA